MIKVTNMLEEERIILDELVKNALLSFESEDLYLINKNVSERSVVSRFAYHLQNKIKELENPLYNDYIVDVEYNRGSKENDYLPKKDPTNDRFMVVDLIVHKRGGEGLGHRNEVRENHAGHDNLICIEFKKTNSSKKSIQKDLERLKKMTDKHGGFFYSAGYMLLIDNKEKQLKIHQRFPHD